MIKAAETIKKEFLESHYQYAKQQPLIGINHVIIYHKGSLALLEKKPDEALVERELVDTPALQTEYNLIKSMAHLSVWLNIILDSIIAKAKQTKQHQTGLLSIRAHLELLKKSDDTLIKNEYKVIDSLIAVIDKIMVSSIEEVKKIQKFYLAQISIINMSYSQKATELQLNGMSQVISSWIEKHKLNLKDTRVLIVCAHGPKQDLIETQYFLHLYKQAGMANAEQLGYVLPVTMLAEQIATLSQEHLINFLRKHQMNSLIGERMLDDPNAMNSDVLGKFAPPVLEKQKCPFHQISSYLKFSLFAPKKEQSEISAEDSLSCAKNK